LPTHQRPSNGRRLDASTAGAAWEAGRWLATTLWAQGCIDDPWPIAIQSPSLNQSLVFGRPAERRCCRPDLAADREGEAARWRNQRRLGMEILVTLILGGIVGWLGSLIMKTNAQMGIIANVIVGIIGSFLGFWLAGQIGLAEGGNVGRWLIAVVGAIILIAILKLLNIFK
jgi:uncharacterized membrane protein YeaQ/YmgE (transglycosylase-associated protein family)